MRSFISIIAGIISLLFVAATILFSDNAVGQILYISAATFWMVVCLGFSILDRVSDILKVTKKNRVNVIQNGLNKN